jgi:hypothetical protein
VIVAGGMVDRDEHESELRSGCRVDGQQLVI